MFVQSKSNIVSLLLQLFTGDIFFVLLINLWSSRVNFLDEFSRDNRFVDKETPVVCNNIFVTIIFRSTSNLR